MAKVGEMKPIEVIEPVIDPPSTSKKVESLEDYPDIKETKFKPVEQRPKIPLPATRKFGYDDTGGFYQYLASLKPEHWVQLIWYIYRTEPKINRPENEKNIDKGNFLFDEDYMIKNHGSGSYFIILTTGIKDGSKICEAKIRIRHADYPPIVNPAEVDVDAKENKYFVDRLIADGKLTPDKRIPMNTNGQQIGGDAVIGLLGRMIDKLDRNQTSGYRDPKDSAITAAFEIISKGNEASTQMLLERMKEQDPDKLVKLIALITGMMKPADKSDDMGMLKVIMEMQAKNAELLAKKEETIMNLMLKMMEKQTNPAPAEDPFDKTLDRFSKIAELTGMGLDGVGGGKKNTLEIVMQYGAPLLERGLGIVQNILAINAQKGQQAQPPTGTANQPPKPSNLPVVVAGVPSETNNQPSKPDVREAMNAGGNQQMEMIKQGLRQLGPQLLSALSRGVTGDAFAESIDNMYGPMIYNQLQGLGEEKIIEALKLDPNLWKELEPIQPALKQFIKEFIEYGAPEEAPKDQVIDINTKPGVINE